VKFSVFWDVAPCSLIGVDRRFRCAYCRHHQCDDSLARKDPFEHSLIIAPMMAAVRTSETSVHCNETTRRYIPEDTKLHICRHENLKSHMMSRYCPSKKFLRVNKSHLVCKSVHILRHEEVSTIHKFDVAQ
jgi:hypothetical protein